jgi:hypothetical protein
MMVCYFIIIIIIIIYKEYRSDCMFRWTHVLATAQQFVFHFYRHTWSLLDILTVKLQL